MSRSYKVELLYQILLFRQMDENTRKLYFNHEDERDKGPSVTSDDLEERIAARRLRIAERVASMQ